MTTGPEAWAAYAVSGGLLHALARPAVQAQLGAILAAVLAASGGMALIRPPLHRRQRRWIVRRLPRRWWGRARRLAAGLRALLLPVVLLAGLAALRAGFAADARPHGLIVAAGGAAVAFLLYRIADRILRLLRPSRMARRTRDRLLLPALLVAIPLVAAGALVPLDDLLNVRLGTVLDTEVTLRAVLLVTVGLYFWIEGTLVVENAVRGYLTRRRRSGGSLGAMLILGRYLGIVAGVALALRLIGLNATTLGFIWGGLSVGIGLSLRGVLANFASGIVLLFERSVRPGDLIEIDGGTRAFVQRLNVRATEARTFDGKEIIIPNEALLTSKVINYSRSDRKVRIEVTVSVAYDSDLRRVLALLEGVARTQPHVLREPRPLVLVRAFGESGIELALLVWVNDLNFLLRNDLSLAIWEAFRREGIEIPFPQRDVRLRAPAPPPEPAEFAEETYDAPGAPSSGR